jgi:predicted ester cyclase
VIVVSFDQNKLLVQRYVEQVVNEQNLAALDELLAADYTCHMSGSPTMDRDGIRGFFSMLHAAFPDQVETIDDLVAEGDKVAVRWSARMTHQGEFMGIAPTRKPVTANGQGFVRVRDGEIVEEHERREVRPPDGGRVRRDARQRACSQLHEHEHVQGHPTWSGFNGRRLHRHDGFQGGGRADQVAVDLERFSTACA